MTVLNQVPIPALHRHQWQAEAAQWHGEVGSWCHECRRALTDLRHLEAALRKQEEKLQGYEEMISSYGERLAAQEWTEADSTPEDAEKVGTLPAVYAERASRHCRQRESHEGFRRRHYTLMAHWALLCQTLTGAQP